MQNAGSSLFFDPYFDPYAGTSSKAHKDDTTGLDSTLLEAPRRPHNRKRICVRKRAHSAFAAPFRPCMLFEAPWEFGRQKRLSSIVI